VGEGGRYQGGGRSAGIQRSNNFISQATLNLPNPRKQAMIMAGRASFETDDASTGSTRSVAAATAAVAAEPASNNKTSLVIAAARTGTGASGMFGQNRGVNRIASHRQHLPNHQRRQPTSTTLTTITFVVSVLSSLLLHNNLSAVNSPCHNQQIMLLASVVRLTHELTHFARGKLSSFKNRR
jgi:hypothetical protein